MDIKRYSEKLIEQKYVQIIFKPLYYINIGQNVNQPLITNTNLSSLGKNSNNSDGNVNPIIPIDNSDSILVKNYNSDLSLQNANTSLPPSYQEILEYHKNLLVEIDSTINKINTKMSFLKGDLKNGKIRVITF